VEQACSSSAFALPVWPAAFTVNQGTHGAPWWTSGVPPTWTDIISCAPERQVDGRFPRFGTSGMESKGSDGRNSGPGRCRCPPQNHGSSLIGGARMVSHGPRLSSRYTATPNNHRRNNAPASKLVGRSFGE